LRPRVPLTGGRLAFLLAWRRTSLPQVRVSEHIMKKSAFPAALLLIGVGLSGCPVYDDDGGCYDDFDCEYGYLCDDDTGACYAEHDDGGDGEACRKPSDCGPNETCSRFGTCSSGDCHYSTVGCVQGYICTVDEGRYACTPRSTNGSEGGAGGSGSGGDAGVGGGSEPLGGAGG
jgi:hypothetical protein